MIAYDFELSNTKPYKVDYTSFGQSFTTESDFLGSSRDNLCSTK